eukprot:12468791-Ditylum_brightwellii.AAC.1
MSKWFILYTSDSKNTLDDIVESKLQLIFQHQIQHGYKVSGYLPPRKANTRMSTTTSYAIALKGT